MIGCEHCCKVKQTRASSAARFQTMLDRCNREKGSRFTLILSIVSGESLLKSFILAWDFALPAFVHSCLKSRNIDFLFTGTEGFKGNARVILPGISACVECTIDLYPPAVSYPLCTIANTPRLPEHCVEYVKVVLWSKENPFGIPLDGDDPQHVSWIYEKSVERAHQFNISGVTYRLVQGVIKNIIPAVASTNAVIAAVCATEVRKKRDNCCSNPQQF